jgi:hypothetical protein
MCNISLVLKLSAVEQKSEGQCLQRVRGNVLE